MKKTFAAFYDVLFVSLISACMYTVSLWIMSRGPVGDLHWYWVIICAVCIAVPTGCIVFGIHKCTIDLVCDRVELVYAILEENITDSDEIDEILLEIYVFIDYHGPALDLYKEMCRHIREKNPVFWRVESPLVRAIFEGKDGLDSAGNMSYYDPASFIRMSEKTSEFNSGDESEYLILPL